ncbi:YheV family putative zinc ribbon protein [Saccharospirillum mangrovi]|uniref:YheV family putative zinc ribbon protein n=1 Tax=Saccharospirillum mangrovi TaxID=2161747 RepID=UPI000D35CF23|nr:YheV family putative zinc ribbon protein [Saccharospirillum mangrovi]
MSIRFIAGAVCPRCGEMDTLKAGNDGNVMVRECVECGFTDRISDSVNAPTELTTRVSEPQRPSDTEAQPVRIIDPTSSTKDSSQ